MLVKTMVEGQGAIQWLRDSNFLDDWKLVRAFERFFECIQKEMETYQKQMKASIRKYQKQAEERDSKTLTIEESEKQEYEQEQILYATIEVPVPQIEEKIIQEQYEVGRKMKKKLEERIIDGKEPQNVRYLSMQDVTSLYKMGIVKEDSASSDAV